jgi:hypothetical protein
MQVLDELKALRASIYTGARVPKSWEVNAILDRAIKYLETEDERFRERYRASGGELGVEARLPSPEG